MPRAAVQGDSPRALGLLQELRSKRFPRLELMEKDADLAAIRRLPGFAPLAAELRKENAGKTGDEMD
ncbi:MAG TPA: hypothetical protein VH988_05645 [Thermoanaerobaculia bacterium]|jgi:hypothetical protein|nr:hypothetical protein [Thermoanaerobaculia bacterium]